MGGTNSGFSSQVSEEEKQWCRFFLVARSCMNIACLRDLFVGMEMCKIGHFHYFSLYF